MKKLNHFVNYGNLKRAFQIEYAKESPFIYFPLDKKDYMSHDKISNIISEYKKTGLSGVIPFSHDSFDIKPYSSDYFETYKVIHKETAKDFLSLGYLDDTYIMREFLTSQDKTSEYFCKILNKYEYSCSEGEKITKKLHNDGELMSLVAVNDDDLEIKDVREFVKDGVFSWTVPEGNWNIEEYVCELDKSSNYIDLMDYSVSMEYIKKTFGVLLDKLGYLDGEESPIDIFIYRNLMYAGQNRRMWSPVFNKRFEELYGFDPAPFYPLLFRSFEGHEKRYKCMLMICRFKIFGDGYLKAAADFCKTRGIFVTGFAAESKATASSWLFGDGQMIHKYASAPGISMPFAYLYGLNAVKVAAGAADQLGDGILTADMFKYYKTLNEDIIYRESMNAYVRGVNMLFTHLGEDRTKEETYDNEKHLLGSIYSKRNDLADFASFAGRCQSLLGGGENVCETAIIYPIYSLHSMVYFYQSDNKGFEYPWTPKNEDYMEIMNSFLNYVGIDTAFIHPEVVAEHSFAENLTLYLSNNNRIMKYKLLIMPSMSVISLKTLKIIKHFFDEGGKIIATGELPCTAVECTELFDNVNIAVASSSPEDAEVTKIIESIFGADALDNTLFKQYYKNTNENGGVAYFFPPNKRSADGTDAVSANMIYQVTKKLGVAPDVFIDRMPRIEFLGAVNFNLPAFLKIGIDKRLSKGCSMNYIHKKYPDADVYYITNTTAEKYKGSVLLRGQHDLEEWDPYNGRIHRLIGELVKFRGEIYTKIELSLKASSCTFIVSHEDEEKKDRNTFLEKDELFNIREFIPSEDL